MFFYDGMTCPVCQKPFAADEDVVACPTCGLPHHRACWQKEKHCHLEALHGTPEQWSREKESATQATEAEAETKTAPEKTRRCPRCGSENPEFSEFCSHCGQPFGEAGWGNSAPCHEYKPFHTPFEQKRSTVSPNEELDGEKATELSAVVGPKNEYYIDRFRRISKGRSGGWNWAAFVFGPYWLLYRKMYVSGGLLLFLNLFQTGVLHFVLNRLSLKTEADLMQFLMTQNRTRTETYYYLAILLVTLLVYAMHFILGAVGNGLYRGHCSYAIRKAKERVPDITPAELTAVGGVSFGIVALGYVASNVLSMLLQTLI